MLARAKGLSGPIERLISSQDCRSRSAPWSMASVLLGSSGYLIVKSLTHFTVLALAAAPLFASIPFMFVRWKRTRRLGSSKSSSRKRSS